MKKTLIFIIIFLIGITNVYAKTDMVINELTINNGEIAPKFDKYNNYYSVTVNKETKQLDFSYLYDEDSEYEVRINNNNDLVQNKFVYLTISNKETKERNTYVFKVYLENDEKEKEVFKAENDTTDINISKKKKNYAPLIITICLILILCVYKIMFL